MRITELLEGKQFNDLDFIKKDGDKSTIDFDLVEDLMFFMNNDDDTYRRHVYPAVADCIECIENNRSTKPSMFKDAVTKSYQNYIKKYPVRDLPDNLEGELFEETCKKFYEEVCTQHSNGKHKD